MNPTLSITFSVYLQYEKISRLVALKPQVSMLINYTTYKVCTNLLSVNDSPDTGNGIAAGLRSGGYAGHRGGKCVVVGTNQSEDSRKSTTSVDCFAPLDLHCHLLSRTRPGIIV